MADVVVVVRLLAILLLLLLFLLRVRRGGVRGRGGRCLALSSLDLALTDSPPPSVFFKGRNDFQLAFWYFFSKWPSRSLLPVLVVLSLFRSSLGSQRQLRPPNIPNSAAVHLIR